MNEGLDSAHDTLEVVLKKAQRKPKTKDVPDFVHPMRKVRVAGMTFEKNDIQNALFLPPNVRIREQIGWMTNDEKAIDREIDKCIAALDKIAARKA